MVVMYHLVCLWPVQRDLVTAITRFGEYGVDLFFVLSGWLIGGLFWKEHTRFGNVQIPRFILRRLIRTIPPYLAALALSYAAVRIARGDPFDWHYLFLLQNYDTTIPYFIVSWSLCVEEHFYLVMPFAAALLIRLSPRLRWVHWVLLALAGAPLLFRAMNIGPDISAAFGFARSATHLRCEGLILGVWASLVCHYRPSVWRWCQRISPAGMLAAIAWVAIASFQPVSLHYVFLYTGVVCFHFFLLITVAERKPLFAGASRVTFWLAATSYSLYLTHQLAIHTVLGFLHPKSPVQEILVLLVVALLVAVVALLFYLMVEKTSLYFRQRFTPPRAATSVASPARPMPVELTGAVAKPGP